MLFLSNGALPCRYLLQLASIQILFFSFITEDGCMFSSTAFNGAFLLSFTPAPQIKKMYLVRTKCSAIKGKKKQQQRGKSSQKEETYSYLTEDLLLLPPQHRKERDTDRIKEVSCNYHKKLYSGCKVLSETCCQASCSINQQLLR